MKKEISAWDIKIGFPYFAFSDGKYASRETYIISEILSIDEMMLSDIHQQRFIDWQHGVLDGKYRGDGRFMLLSKNTQNKINRDEFEYFVLNSDSEWQHIDYGDILDIDASMASERLSMLYEFPNIKAEAIGKHCFIGNFLSMENMKPASILSKHSPKDAPCKINDAISFFKVRVGDEVFWFGMTAESDAVGYCENATGTMRLDLDGRLLLQAYINSIQNEKKL